MKNQDDTLTGDLSSVDKATTENLENLVEVGEQLLKKPLSRINLETGEYEPIENGGTNEEALKRYVKVATMHFFIFIYLYYYLSYLNGNPIYC